MESLISLFIGIFVIVLGFKLLKGILRFIVSAVVLGILLFGYFVGWSTLLALFGF